MLYFFTCSPISKLPISPCLPLNAPNPFSTISELSSYSPKVAMNPPTGILFISPQTKISAGMPSIPYLNSGSEPFSKVLVEIH
jgi:hypothetical protein